MFDKYIEKYSDTKGIINSLGLVFGDIGTSPIYTLTVIFLLLNVTEENVIGVLSLIVWTLIILVTIEYAWLAMDLSKKGEGGTIVLKEILVPLLKSGRKVTMVTLLSYIGISFLIGDGVITPAISILSAVEGLRLIPGYQDTGQMVLIIIASIIAILLFLFQKKGTEKVAWTFGPLMIIWFLSIAISGIVSISHTPTVLRAINPYYAIKFMIDNGLAGFFVLSEVILCATGGEALYADMGHLGREPILKAWRMVFIALVLSYIGQGAFIIRHPNSTNILFEMIFQQASILYIPFLILGIMATVVASQAMISGMFSIMYQAINTHIAPMFKIDYTSNEMKSQIYIGVVNWILLISVLFIIFQFQESHNLAAAYGLAVTGTMTITGIMMTIIFYMKNDMFKAFVASLVTFVDAVFLMSNLYKIPHGGYWSIIISFGAFVLIMAYTLGQNKLHQSLRSMNLEIFLAKYNGEYDSANKIRGTALYFARNVHKIPPYIPLIMFKNEIIYEDNIIISINIRDTPFGVTSYFKNDLAKGLRVYEISMGYMEVIDVVKILKSEGIDEKTIFYGIEDIITDNVLWKIFSTIKKLSPSFVQFYDLPHDKIHGVVTRLEM
jgi:KUP system potassium uptake protein